MACKIELGVRGDMQTQGVEGWISPCCQLWGVRGDTQLGEKLRTQRMEGWRLGERSRERFGGEDSELSGERRLIYGREVREERRQKLKRERKLLLDHAYILAAVNK